MPKVNLADKLSRFSDHWHPRIVAELNGQHVKLAKLEGEFVWHQHAQEDELFLVVHGHLTIHLRDQTVELDEGELFVVPRGVEHLPVADQEAHVLFLEPASTLKHGRHPQRTDGRRSGVDLATRARLQLAAGNPTPEWVVGDGP